MYALGDIHDRDDERIRDEALRAYVRESGPGLPLFIAGLVEKEVRRQVDDALRDYTLTLRRELERQHPIWSRVRRLAARMYRTLGSRQRAAGGNPE